jgi:ADP-heptose:LPS heptosyltransferase
MIRGFSHRFAKPEKTCAVVRYGAMGDALQSASVFPWLKSQGYHITMYTVPNGHLVLRNDPHVDRFIVQDVDAIPNEFLGEFWAYTAKRYDKFINFSESVERSLLAQPGNTNHGWSYEMRHKYLNHNYLEFMHDIAGVPYEPKVKFYPSKQEHEWALMEYARIGRPAVLWCLGGSAHHKHWPHIDEAIASMTASGLHVVTVGDELCKIQEQGFESNPMIHCRSWVWTMRQSLAFSQVCDLVIGPETGMLNAVSFENVPKIVTLSHSSADNLTRDWVNCTSLVPENTACYPCHRMHYSFEFCHEGYKDGQVVGALCQVNISVKQMLDAVSNLLNKREEMVA